MSDKSASTPSKQPAAQKPAYISSSGHSLTSLPLSARLNRFVDNAYNFLGLYIVSLLSLDPYTAAQNSRFNTRGLGRNTGNASTGSSTGTSSGGLWGGGRLGGGGASGNAGPRSGGSGGGRRVGTVDDVRGPECGSCG